MTTKKAARPIRISFQTGDLYSSVVFFPMPFIALLRETDCRIRPAAVLKRVRTP